MVSKNEKYIIGLTGNIASGKTVVRKMLEHLGAYGIDADVLSHRVIAKGAPGYQPLIQEFGRYILRNDGNIDRKRLGGIAFSDPDALARLEAIVHPLVRKAAIYLIENANQPVIVLEAIKLLESPLLEIVDSVWVVTATEEVQIDRMKKSRHMTEEEARKRMVNQSSQEEKISKANVVIRSDRSFDDTWAQVSSAYKHLFPDTRTGNTMHLSAVNLPAQRPKDLINTELRVERAKPGQAKEIAQFINRMNRASKPLSRMDVMAMFGEKAYSLLFAEDYLVGVIGWQVENLVTSIDELWLDNGLNQGDAISMLISHVEKASSELQAEAAFVFAQPGIADNIKIWLAMNFQICTPEYLEINDWQEAASAKMKPGTVMFFKQLRADRVLRPI